MKTVWTFAAVAIAVACLAASASADPQWILAFRATNQDNPTSGHLASQCLYGLRTGAEDGLDTQDSPNAAGTGSSVAMGCFDLGANPYSGNGYYRDFHAVGTTNLVWNLKVWLQAGCTASAILLSGWGATGTFDLVGPPIEFCVPSLGLSYVFDGTLNGSSTEPLFTWTIDTQNATLYKGVDNALPALLRLVPEPPSALALLSGIATLGAFIGRRRA